jgi:hypothetical protein
MKTVPLVKYIDPLPIAAFLTGFQVSVVWICVRIKIPVLSNVDFRLLVFNLCSCGYTCGFHASLAFAGGRTVTALKRVFSLPYYRFFCTLCFVFNVPVIL